jgi:hypothetical protein
MYEEILETAIFCVIAFTVHGASMWALYYYSQRD